MAWFYFILLYLLETQNSLLYLSIYPCANSILQLAVTPIVGVAVGFIMCLERDFTKCTFAETLFCDFNFFFSLQQGAV